jgi:hypothetical protein
MRHLIYSIAFALAALISLGTKDAMAEEAAYTPESGTKS